MVKTCAGGMERETFANRMSAVVVLSSGVQVRDKFKWKIQMSVLFFSEICNFSKNVFKVSSALVQTRA